MKTLLISDIYGLNGRNIDYLSHWRECCEQAGSSVEILYLNQLYPAAYATDEFSLDFTHQTFVKQGIVESTPVLDKYFQDYAPDQVIGFSLGGFLACLARPSLKIDARLIAISATRLRHVQSVSGHAACTVVFGENDPHRPTQPLLSEGLFKQIVLPGADHDVYLDMKTCLPALAE